MNGWYWRFIALSIAVVAILEIIAYEVTKGGYNFLASGELGMFMVAILVVQRVKERRTANTLVAVIASLVINLILQLTVGYADTVKQSFAYFAEQNGMFALIGVLFSVVYARTTAWSDKRRQATEEKRKKERQMNAHAENPSQERIHRVKKKQGRGRRN